MPHPASTAMTLESVTYEHGWWICLLVVGVALALWLRSTPEGAAGSRERILLATIVVLTLAPFAMVLGSEWAWPKCHGRTFAMDALLARGLPVLLLLQALSPLPACIVAKGHRLRAGFFAVVIAVAGFWFSLLASFPYIMGDCAPIVENGTS